jgi:hypothetical protein
MLESSEDSAGYHLFLARGASAYAWTPLATIKPTGLDVGAWTGYSCLTGDGKYAIAVVAPSYFTNSPLLRDRGAFAYVVDVRTGAVRPVVAGVALKYYSPCCGAGDTAILTRNMGDDQARTQLLSVNAATAAIGYSVDLPGQVTSAVPAPANSIIAARGAHVVRVTSQGRESVVGQAAGQVFDLAVTASGSGAFLAAAGKQALVYQLVSHGVRQLAFGKLTTTYLFSGRGGRPIVAAGTLAGSVPATVALTVRRGIPADVDTVSLDGKAIAGWSPTGKLLQVRATGTGLTVPATQSLPTAARASSATPSLTFGFNAVKPTSVRPTIKAPAAVAKSAATDKIAVTSKTAAAASVTTPGCAVPRLSPTMQVPQPGPQQVERAVDLAVSGNLLDQRPANYLNMGLVAYKPSTDFAPVALSGGGTVPANVYLGILAQESNLDQASWHALPGIAGDPLVADYYGAGGGITTIDYADADCGYGIGQVTTGMDYGDTSVYSAHGQMKIAADYEENIAAGLQILEQKWNQLAGLGVVANNGSAADIENWYFAIWAYNTGWHTADSAGNYGLGWTNNPANPDYPPNRENFLETTYADAAHPGNWAYQERVLGWVSEPQNDIQGDPAYAKPTYGSNNATGYVFLPPINEFCNSSDDCTAADINTGGSSDSVSPCGYSSLPSSNPLYAHCWWHSSASWVSAQCPTCYTTQKLTYAVGSADPGQTDPHPADCNSTLPSSAIIVDDLATPADNVAGCTNMNWTTTGSFSLLYATDANGNPTGAIDTHQLGVGFGGHLYFAHNRTESDTANLVTGIWTASLPTHLYNIYVHLPSTGGTTDFANYEVTDSTGTVSDSVISQHTNQDEWASIGYFEMGSNATVTLSNVTQDAVDGAHDVAYDAIAFVPVAGTSVHHSFDAVSIFKPTQDIDTATIDIVPNTPMQSMADLHTWAMSRTAGGPAWNDSSTTVTGLTQYPSCGTGAKTAHCIGSATLTAAQSWETEAEQAGSVAAGVSNGMTPAKMMGFANAVPNPSVAPATEFNSDSSYKIKTHIDVWWVVDSSGNLVPGSERLDVTTRTGTTEIPDWVRNFAAALQTDYGITVPNLAYSEFNANAYTGDSTAVANPLTTGLAPGEAYLPHTSPLTVDPANSNCVIVHTESGGTIGYRPLDDQTSATDANMSAWVQEVQNDVNAGLAPQPLADTAADIYNMFFRGWDSGGIGEGSLFTHAGPIWQELHMEFCTNGSIKPLQTTVDADDSPDYGLVYQSYMPDLYLYYDNQLVDNTGAATTSPAQSGNFYTFSSIPTSSGGGDSAYGLCNIANTGNAGNPWGVGIPVPGVSENFVPKSVTYCDDGTSYYDPGAL